MSDKELELRMTRYKIEGAQGWRDEIKRIPFISFPAEWAIQVIPPFGDAVSRFRVRLPSGTEKSIYLDCRESLGYFGEPYWEVYPWRGDVGRCAMNDTTELLSMIADESEDEQ